jgi:hypothetical protein
MLGSADRITPIGDWFRARALSVPIGGRTCNEARIIEARVEAGN